MIKSKDVKILINHQKLDQLRSKNQPALFLDRDGVIIKEKHYLKEPNLVELEHGIKELINKSLKANWLIVIITNQSGIDKGLFGWKEYEQVTNQMLNLLGENNYPTGIYANSQAFQKTNNCWRKPSPNMLFQASKDLNIDLRKSILIGDRLSDLKAGINAGLLKTYHLASGHGKKERNEVLKYISKLSEEDKKTEFTKILCIESLMDLPNNLFGTSLND